MANNVIIDNGNLEDYTVKTTSTANVHVQHVNVDTMPTTTVTVSGTAAVNDSEGNVPTATSALSAYHFVGLSTTGQVIKASAGMFYDYYFGNADTAAVYVKIYDKATAPTSSDTPIHTCFIPAGNAANRASHRPIACTAGISIRCSTGIADNDNTAPTASTISVNVAYK